MIGYLRGKLIKKTPNNIIIDVNGVGYELTISTFTFNKLCKINENVILFCYLKVREDAHTLYGFIDEMERSLFKTLIKVNGVGPKLAITILSNLSSRELISAIQNNSIKTLTSIPGIGQKSADRLLIELKDMFKKLLAEFDQNFTQGITNTEMLNTTSTNVEESIHALGVLGFKQNEINKVIVNIATDGKSNQEIIKEALRLLAR